MKHLIFLFAVFVLSSCGCRYGCENGVCKKRICSCDNFWEGDACDISSVAKYQGTYFGTNNCDSGNREYSLAISGVGQMTFDGQLTIQFGEEERFYFDNQLFNGDVVSGEGQMLLDKISLMYVKVDSIDSVECSISAQLQN